MKADKRYTLTLDEVKQATLDMIYNDTSEGDYDFDKSSIEIVGDKVIITYVDMG